jgi:hypothetical protein
MWNTSVPLRTMEATVRQFASAEACDFAAWYFSFYLVYSIVRWLARPKKTDTLLSKTGQTCSAAS